jgi:hypothetical protein
VAVIAAADAAKAMDDMTYLIQLNEEISLTGTYINLLMYIY